MLVRFERNFYTRPQFSGLTMKTKDRFFRFHLLCLRRPSTTLLLMPRTRLGMAGLKKGELKYD
jgi:hypothetical protein